MRSYEDYINDSGVSVVINEIGEDITHIIMDLVAEYKEESYKSEKTKNIYVYYTKRNKNNIYKRKCVFVNSTQSAMIAVANEKNWRIERVEYLLDGKNYAIKNGIAYTEDSGATWIFDHC